MIEHVWTVVCSRAIVDQDSNNVSLENILEQITVWGTPTPGTIIPMPFHVMTAWIRADADIPARGRMRLTFELPSGHVFKSPIEMEVDLTQCIRHRQKVKFSGIPIAEAGRHFVRIEFQNEDEELWRPAALVPLDIDFKPREE